MKRLLPVGPGIPQTNLINIFTKVCYRGGQYWKRRVASKVKDGPAIHGKLVNEFPCLCIPYLQINRSEFA